MRLIDADELARYKSSLAEPIRKPSNDDEVYMFRLGGNDAIDAIMEFAPTVNAVPVTRPKDGHWEHGKELSRDYIGYACIGVDYDKWWCSECNYHVKKRPLWRYCPNCGAKMDEQET